MAIEVNIAAPVSGATVNPAGGDLQVSGFARAPGAIPTIEVVLVNANSFETFRVMATVSVVASAPRYYSWLATFATPANFNIPMGTNKFHCVKSVLTTPMSGTPGDFITRIAEVHIKGAGFTALRRRGKKTRKS
jgi:hypothetical protein